MFRTTGPRHENEGKPVRLNRRNTMILAAGLAASSVLGSAGPAPAAIAAQTGNITVLQPPPPDVRLEQLTSDEVGFAFAERTCATLSAPLPVDIIDPVGTYGAGQTNPGLVPAGTPVDSYLVHLDNVGDTGNAFLSGSLTFDQPVLGIILLPGTLNASDPVVGAPGTLYPTGDTQFRGYEAPDTVTVSPDGFTVTFAAVSGSRQDDVRIITAGTCPLLPTAKEQCKDGGWEAFGFRNPGQCVSFVATGGKH